MSDKQKETGQRQITTHGSRPQLVVALQSLLKQQLICLRDEAACACVGSHDLSFDMATWIILLLIQVCNEHGYVMDI